jgi:cell division protein FtsQ
MIDAVLERLQRGPRSRSRTRSPRSPLLARPGRRRRPRPRVLLALAGLLLLLAGAWMWLRDSSLVAVNRVTVTGATGADAGQIRSALIVSGRNMTTLDVHMDQLQSAVAPFPVVKALRVSTQFPHGMRIRVIEQIPVAAVVVAGRLIAVAGDGTLLRGAVVPQNLPTIPLSVPPGGTHLTDPRAMAAVALLAVAPDQLLTHVSQVQSTSAHGLVASLRNGPSIYFGDSGRPHAKWAAVTAVLANPGSAGAAYIDVDDPERPAAGPTAPASTAGGAAGPTAPASTAGGAAGPTAPASAGAGSASGAPVSGTSSGSAGGASVTPAGG